MTRSCSSRAAHLLWDVRCIFGCHVREARGGAGLREGGGWVVHLAVHAAHASYGTRACRIRTIVHAGLEHEWVGMSGPGSSTAHGPEVLGLGGDATGCNVSLCDCVHPMNTVQAGTCMGKLDVAQHSQLQGSRCLTMYTVYASWYDVMRCQSLQLEWEWRMA